MQITSITNPYTGLYWISFESFVHWKTNNMRFRPPALQCCCCGGGSNIFIKKDLLMGNPYPANYFCRMNFGTERFPSPVTITQPKLCRKRKTSTITYAWSVSPKVEVVLHFICYELPCLDRHCSIPHESVAQFQEERLRRANRWRQTGSGCDTLPVDHDMIHIWL